MEVSGTKILKFGTNEVVEQPNEVVENKVEPKKEIETKQDEKPTETVEEQKPKTETVETEQNTSKTPSEKESIEYETKEQPQQPELTEDIIVGFLKDNYGVEAGSLKDILEQKQAKTENELDGVSDEVKAFLKYHKETNGRSISDWLELGKDYSQLSPLEVAREKAIKQSGGQLSTKDVDAYLERKLNISLENPSELEKFDLIELQNYGRDFLDQKIADQSKYKQPKTQDTNQFQDDYLLLENGAYISKQQYKQYQTDNRNYIESIKRASDNIKASNFSVEFDNNEEKLNIDVAYDYTKDDKHKMVALGSDVNQAFNTLFQSENGTINPAKVQEGMRWADEGFRQKVIPMLINKAIAQVVDLIVTDRNNFKVDSTRIPQDTGDNKIVPMPGIGTLDYGVKF